MGRAPFIHRIWVWERKWALKIKEREGEHLGMIMVSGVWAKTLKKKRGLSEKKKKRSLNLLAGIDRPEALGENRLPLTWWFPM